MCAFKLRLVSFQFHGSKLQQLPHFCYKFLSPIFGDLWLIMSTQILNNFKPRHFACKLTSSCESYFICRLVCLNKSFLCTSIFAIRLKNLDRWFLLVSLAKATQLMGFPSFSMTILKVNSFAINFKYGIVAFP